MTVNVLVFVVFDVGTGLYDVIRMAHTAIPPPRCTAATLELTHKGNIIDKTITMTERDKEVRDFNVTLLASAITHSRHLVIDTHRTNLGVTRQACHYINEMIVTVNRTCVLLARPTHNALLHLALERSVRGLECTQHSALSAQ